MKTNIKRVLGVCLSAISLGIMATPAMARPTKAIKFQLMQPTSIKGVMMPAGMYTIRDLGSDSSLPLLQIRSDEDARVQVTTFADQRYSKDLQSASNTGVTLRYDGKVYRLDTIRLAGSNMTYHLSQDPEGN